MRGNWLQLFKEGPWDEMSGCSQDSDGGWGTLEPELIVLSIGPPCSTKNTIYTYIYFFTVLKWYKMLPFSTVGE